MVQKLILRYIEYVGEMSGRYTKDVNGNIYNESENLSRRRAKDPLRGNDRPGGPCTFNIPVGSPPSRQAPKVDGQYSMTSSSLVNNVDVVNPRVPPLITASATFSERNESLFTKLKRILKF
jgi:hypothetical protein